MYNYIYNYVYIYIYITCYICIWDILIHVELMSAYTQNVKKLTIAVQ